MNVIVLFIVGCVIKGLQGQQCMTPNNRQGQCISIYQCAPLLAIAQKMLPQDIEFLRRSQCGRVEGVPAVCCAVERQTPPPPPRTPPPPPPPTPPPPPPPTDDQCFTPEGRPGKCVDLYSCPNLVNLLQESSSNENIGYVQRSRCNGPGPRSVCCGFSTLGGSKPKNKCEGSISALLPNPTSGCCGIDISVSNKIFGGDAATIDQYPWLALIEYSKFGQTTTACGGTLISGKYVLTAAHCLVGPILEKNGRPIKVRLGEYDKDNEGPDCAPAEAGGEDCTTGVLRIPIERTVAHSEYNKKDGPRWHDIGLIRLTQLAPFTDFIRPICLPKNDITLNSRASYNLTTAGWGAVSDREKSSSVKLYVDLPYVPQSQCQTAHSSLKVRVPLTNGQLCAGGVKGKDSCKGDSGGPLMYDLNRQFQIVGIVSFGHRECGKENFPGVYTNVYQYDAWIRSNITP